MNDKDKELLLKDLCARLPYNVSVNYKGKIYSVLGIAHNRLVLCKPFMSQTLEYCPLVEEVKPYLFPMSSMTEEQEKEYNSLRDFVPTYHYEFGDIIEDTELYDNFESIDYLIANHFDYRNLIPKGLAIDCTGLNIYV